MALEDIPWDTLIGGTALVLSIIGIYYTYKSVKTPILIEARKRHTQELIEFLKEWHDKFPLYESATEPKMTLTPSTSVIHLNEPCHDFPEIETNWKYKDLIQYHLPREYKTLPAEWDRYKKFVDEYGTLRYELYEKIKKDAIKKTNLKYDPNWKGEHIISQHFVIYIYQQSISWRRDGRLYFDKKFMNYKIERGNELWFSGGGLAKGNKEELEKAKEIFEEMMFSEEYLNKYEREINEIIEYERKLEEMYNKLKAMIEKLIGYPILPGTKCEILKSLR